MQQLVEFIGVVVNFKDASDTVRDGGAYVCATGVFTLLVCLEPANLTVSPAVTSAWHVAMSMVSVVSGAQFIQVWHPIMIMPLVQRFIHSCIALLGELLFQIQL